MHFQLTFRVRHTVPCVVVAFVCGLDSCGWVLELYLTGMVVAELSPTLSHGANIDELKLKVQTLGLHQGHLASSTREERFSETALLNMSRLVKQNVVGLLQERILNGIHAEENIEKSTDNGGGSVNSKVGPSGTVEDAVLNPSNAQRKFMTTFSTKVSSQFGSAGALAAGMQKDVASERSPGPYLSRTRSSNLLRSVGRKDNKLYHHVIITLAYVPGFRIKRYLGQINLHFIRESWSVKGEGGIGTFYHETLMHAQAMCRAHIVAQGGNALTFFRLKVSLLFKHTQYIHHVALLKQPLFWPHIRRHLPIIPDFGCSKLVLH